LHNFSELKFNWKAYTEIFYPQALRQKC